jgi:YbgC/YbaW family acyl-CoA thioester hydrolase
VLLSPRLRALSVLPGALLGPPATASMLRFRVRLFDVDLNVHLTNSRYPQLMDAGRLDLLLRARMLWPLLKDGVTPLVVESTIQFRRELKLGVAFELHTRITGLHRRAVLVEQRFVVGEKEHARATVRLLLSRGGRIIDPSPYLPVGVREADERAPR